MLDPLILLTTFATIVIIAVIAFYPQHGVVPRIRRVLRLSGRVRLEDALKHGLHEQLEGRFATINSIAGALEITRRGATALVWELEHLGFITVDERGVHLTEPGHAYATRVVRNHRLWERYLADRTAVQPAAWHEKAEIAEHRLTEHDANRLAARMGYPLFDPHGDPIPTERGDLPVVDGVALTELRAGQHATIVHIEDEPVEIFERIVSEGFRPLMRLKVLDVSPTNVVVSVEGEQHTLDPLVARNFTVHPIAAADDRSSSRFSPCSKTLAICRAWRSIWTVCFGARAHTGNRR